MGWVQNDYGAWRNEEHGLVVGQSAKKYWNVWVGEVFHNVAMRRADEAKAEAERLAGLEPAEPGEPVEYLGPEFVGGAR